MMLIACAVVLGVSIPAFAQRSSAHRADWKILGKDAPGYGDNYGFSRSVQHAADYARDAEVYAQQNTKSQPAVAKTIVTELGRNLETAKKHLAAMKKSAGNDKDTLAAIESIETHLTAAFDHHKTLHACCVENFDMAKTLHCCADLTKELDAVIAEHNELMHKLAKHQPAAK
jgi:hypothetical protein